MNLIEFLNSSAAEAVGGLVTTSIVGIVKKIKDAFKGKSINQEELEKLMSDNSEIRDAVSILQEELIKGNIINNADRIEIKNQFINSKFENTTFN